MFDDKDTSVYVAGDIISVTPLISIIVPIYKVEPYLRKCLESIIGQTYCHLEIILVDDGSPDSCGEICDEYAAKDERITVIHQENTGLPAARNAGLDIANGDYIMFVDSDDWIEKETCACLIAIAQQHGADMVCFGYNEIGLSGNINRWFYNEPGEIEKKEMIRLIISGTACISDVCWNKLYSRKLFENIRFPVGKMHEDFGTTYRLVHLAQKIYVSDSVLYNYVRNKGSISISCYPTRLAKESRHTFLEERLDFLNVFYPEFVDIQLLQALSELIFDQDKAVEKEDRIKIQNQLDKIVDAYRSRMPFITRQSKNVWVFYYCHFLLKPFLRLRRYLKK